MADDNRPTINISGSNIQAGISNIGGNQTFQGAVTLGDLSATINAMPAADQSDKARLESLLKQLEEALKSAPADKSKDAQKIADRTRELVAEAGQEEVDKEEVEHRANLLKKAAENIQGALPAVFGAAILVVDFIRKLHGG